MTTTASRFAATRGRDLLRIHPDGNQPGTEGRVGMTCGVNAETAKVLLDVWVRRLAVGMCGFLALVSVARADQAKDSQVATIDAFFSALRGPKPPSIGDYQRLFGPHGEEELTLQLRYEGVPAGRRGLPPEDVVARINRRLLDPQKHTSLFLCFLRSRVPATTSEAWRIAGPPRQRGRGISAFRVEAGAEALLFEFVDGDPYIEALLRGNGKRIGAEDFVSSCRPGNCCTATR